MAKRMLGSMRSRHSLSDLIRGPTLFVGRRAERVKLADRLIIEEALEAEQRDAPGRNFHEHGTESGEGYRNGVRPGPLKTAEGVIEYSVP